MVDDIIAILSAFIEQWYPLEVKLESCHYVIAALPGVYLKVVREILRNSSQIPDARKELMFTFEGPEYEATLAKYARCTEGMSGSDAAVLYRS